MLPVHSVKLRYFVPEDATRVAELLGDIAVSKWTSNIPHPYCKQDALNWIESTSSSADRHPYAVEVENEIVACVSFWPYDSGSVEVGYWVGKDYWGQGICTAALSQLMASDAFPNTAEVVAKVMMENTGSERVLQKCGFRFAEHRTIAKQGREIAAKFYVKQIAT